MRFHDIITAYYNITGIPSIVNTSFNMHESPIIATPEDAVRTFQEGHLDHLAIGPFLASQNKDPRKEERAADVREQEAAVRP